MPQPGGRGFRWPQARCPEHGVVSAVVFACHLLAASWNCGLVWVGFLAVREFFPPTSFNFRTGCKNTVVMFARETCMTNFNHQNTDT